MSFSNNICIVDNICEVFTSEILAPGLRVSQARHLIASGLFCIIHTSQVHLDSEDLGTSAVPAKLKPPLTFGSS